MNAASHSSDPSKLLRSARSILHVELERTEDDIASFGADLYALDLEDGVPRSQRESRRRAIHAALEQGRFDALPLLVRVSRFDAAEDIRCTLHPAVRAYIVPMLRGPEELQRCDAMIQELWAAAGLGSDRPWLVPVYETLSAIVRPEAMLDTEARVAAAVFGAADLAAEVGVAERGDLMAHARARVVLAARGRGLGMFDTPCFVLDDPALLEREARRARAEGFSGKIALTPRHVALIQAVFGPDPVEQRRARAIEAADLAGANTLQLEGGRRFIGPPHVHGSERTLAAAIECPAPTPREGRRPRPAPLRAARRPKVIGSLFEIPGDYTVQTGELWNTAFFNVDRLETSAQAAQTLGLRDRLVPFSLMIGLTPGLSVPYLSEAGRFHLSFFDGVAVRPCHVGDTIRASFYIRQVRPTSDGRHEVVESIHALEDEAGRVLVRVGKRTLFVREATPWDVEEDALAANERRFDTSSSLRARVLSWRPEFGAQLRIHGPQPTLVAGDVFTHRMVKVFGSAESRALSNLLRATNPHHYDQQHFSPTNLVVPGPCVVTASLANALDDLGDVLYREIDYASNMNRVNIGDQIGSVSAIVDVQPVEGNDALEQVSVKTLGIKNLDMRLLHELELPVALLGREELKPRAVEALCASECPLLLHRVASQALTRFLRPR